MKLEVKQVLEDIRVFKEAVYDIRFMKNSASWYNNFPSIVDWTEGDIVLVKNKELRDINRLKQRLAGYGINAEIVSVDGYTGNAVKFAAKSSDDIIFVLHKVMQEVALRSKARKMEYQLDCLNQNIDQLTEQLPDVRRGAFSSGVNDFKSQVAVLGSVRARYRKQNGR